MEEIPGPRPSNQLWPESTRRLHRPVNHPGMLYQLRYPSDSIARLAMGSLRTALVVLAVAAAASVASTQPAGQPFRPSPSSPVDDGAWYPLIVTGGRAALDALGVPPSADLGSTMVELVRRLHLSAGPPPELNAGILELSIAVGDLGRLQNAVAAASAAGRPPTLALASQRESRKRFEAALGAAGLVLRESNNQHTVEANPSERETALRARLKIVGVDVEAIRSRLMKGEPLTFTVPTLELPLPLSPRAWTARILERSVPPSELFTAILSDRRARLLYHGLVGLDANTRRWISNQRGVLKHLYRDEESVRSFALFGPAVHVADGKVVVPGGPAAARRWSTLLGADPAIPDQFITRLFDTELGRVAGLYFTAAGVDERSRQFMLGLSAPASDGDARFGRLASAFAGCYPKQSTRYPFNVRSYDPALLLTQIPLTEKGVLAGPRWRRFWELGLSGDSLPSDPASELRDVGRGRRDRRRVAGREPLCEKHRRAPRGLRDAAVRAPGVFQYRRSRAAGSTRRHSGATALSGGGHGGRASRYQQQPYLCAPGPACRAGRSCRRSSPRDYGNSTVPGSARAHHRHHPSPERDVGRRTRASRIPCGDAVRRWSISRGRRNLAGSRMGAGRSSTRPVTGSGRHDRTDRRHRACWSSHRQRSLNLVGRPSLRRRLCGDEETPARCRPRARRWTDARRRAGAGTHRVGAAAKRDRPGARGPIRTRSCAARSTTRRRQACGGVRRGRHRGARRD